MNEWVKHYELNKEEAFLKLIQLILNAAGKIGTVTSEIMYIENCDSLLEMPTDSENV